MPDTDNNNDTLRISLHCPSVPLNAPSLSGYCQKLETIFRLVSFDKYTLVPTAFRASPTGKLPFITIHHHNDGDGGSVAPAAEVIADSHFIVRKLIERGIIPDPDAALTEAQKADSRALSIWTEHHLYLAVVQQRWARDHNARVVIPTLPLPWLGRPLIAWYLRRSIVSSLWTNGIGRYTDAEIDEFVAEWLQALEVRLADGREWLLSPPPPPPGAGDATGNRNNDDDGATPYMVDATVWAFLVNCLGIGEGNTEVVAGIRKRPGVCSFIRRGAARWFPEYDVEKMLDAPSSSLSSSSSSSP